MNPDYETITAAQFTELHDLTLEQFELWVLAGRPTLFSKPVICEDLEHYRILLEE